MGDYPDYSPTAVDVVLKAVWAAEDGTDKDFFVTGVNKSAGQYVSTTYAVPSGKTLYITDIEIGMYPAAADYDHQLWCLLYAYLGVAGSVVQTMFSGGGGLAFAKPQVIDAGLTFDLRAYNFSNITVAGLFASAHGYEV